MRLENRLGMEYVFFLDNFEDVGFYFRRFVGRLIMIEMMKFVFLKKLY